MSSLAEHGWLRFDDPDLLAWAEFALPVAREISMDETARAQWLRHGRTWFAGVNIMPNDGVGALPGGPALSGHALRLCEEIHRGKIDWDAAQLSIVYPGYPIKDPAETEAAYGFRLRRDAAHVDGLLPIGSDRRRMMQEPHSFVLGIPLTECDADASPMVIWEGSHHLIRAAFQKALADTDPRDWDKVDLTEIYQTARRRCFEDCQRVVIHARPGQGYLLHRLALHGVAPWGQHAKAPVEGRMIAYFRPPFPSWDWLNAP